MTVTPWSDAAKALVGVAFGNPAMRSEAEKTELEKQKVDIQQKQYQLEEALNPAKIKQAEAAAGYNNAQTQSEGVKMLMDQLKLDSQRGFLEGGGQGAAPTMAPMPAFNPYNVGPQGQGRNPAITTPYDQIEPQPLDMSAIEGDALPKLPPPDLVPLTMDSLGASAPVATNPFDELIAGLTAPDTQMPPQPTPIAPIQQTQPQDMADMLTPEMRQMMAAGYLPGQNIGDYLLAQEGFNANTGVTDPNKRIQNAAAGRGTFLSPDQTTAQAMGSTLPTSKLSELGVTNMGTNDIKNFNLSQANPDFAEFLAVQNAGQEIEFNPDGTIKRIGKGKGPGGKLTEVQGKYALFGTRAAQAQQNLEKVLSSDYGKNMANMDVGNSIDFITGMSKPESATGTLVSNALQSPEGRQLYQASNSFLTAIVRPDSGAALTPDEWQIYGKIFIPMPGDDSVTVEQKRIDRQIATTALQSLSNGGAGTIANMLQAKGIPVPKELEAYLTQEGGDPTGLVDQPTEPEVTATGPNGEKIVLRNGQWQPM